SSSSATSTTTSTTSSSGGSNSGSKSGGGGSSGGSSAKSATNSAGTSAGTSASTAATSSTTGPGLVLASRGSWGGQMAPEIDGARPQKELAYALPVNPGTGIMRTSDLRTIMYLLASPGQPGDLTGRGGLARREGDRYAVTSAEMMGQNAAGDFATQVIAPEII